MALDFENLTVDYGDLAGEAQACRTQCALFDFSFLERASVAGPKAQSVIETFTGRSMATLAVGRIRYALRVDAEGRLAADLTVWRTDENDYEVMSGRREDVRDLRCFSSADCRVRDLGTAAVFALQGPQSLEALRPLADIRLIEALPYFGFCRGAIAGIACTIGRLGYTGEAGFEIIAAREHGATLWRELAKRARPAGFAAADMLRIEAGLVLFANEFALPVSASEAGLGQFIERADVPHANPLRLVCFCAASASAPVLWRPTLPLTRPRQPGAIVVTSACRSLAANGILGLGYVAAHDVATHLSLHDPTGVFRDIQLVAMPFYDEAKRRPRAPWPRDGTFAAS
jgi:aminomethyltransferase